jgi:hypothetical protein
MIWNWREEIISAQLSSLRTTVHYFFIHFQSVYHFVKTLFASHLLAAIAAAAGADIYHYNLACSRGTGKAVI